MNTIKLFFANIRRKFFNWRINREIFHRISPHLRNEGNHGYPFHSKDEMAEQHIHSGLNAHIKFDMIELTAAKMPRFQGDAFRYIAYRDLNDRMEMYLALAKESVQPDECDPRSVMCHA